ncbi:MAG: hypothetical protein DSM106950_19080 [Stigonema ocellatum SAG 48.90 = DSM 106950]|nr:hypothetical protein [Stigonema ocellatum SAG 48.90 = DSM 106950]
MSLIRAKKIVSVFISSSLVLASAIMTPLKPVQALGPGRVCMFKAPSGATYGVVDAGHVGWAYEVGNSGSWAFGATEVADGKPSSTWSKSGDWNAVLDTFKRGAGFHGIGYYTQYRCRNTASSAVGAANNEAQREEDNGYDFEVNNCLTKSVLIFNAYGVSDLPGAGYTLTLAGGLVAPKDECQG